MGPCNRARVPSLLAAEARLDDRGFLQFDRINVRGFPHTPSPKPRAKVLSNVQRAVESFFKVANFQPVANNAARNTRLVLNG